MPVKKVNTAKVLKEELGKKSSGKRMKVRTLLNLFGYQKKRESNVGKIMEALASEGIMINPPLVRVDKGWSLKQESMVRLSLHEDRMTEENHGSTSGNAADPWFGEIENKEYRTEREVETKFLIPLLSRLGYSEDDRYDGMVFHAFQGSKPLNLEVDIALFDTGNELLQNQVLLVSEAKREQRLGKQVEIVKAQRQTKSYAIWLSCHFGLVTDSNIIQVLDLFPSIGGLKVLFECRRDELGSRFSELNSLVSKESLVKYYERLLK